MMIYDGVVNESCDSDHFNIFSFLKALEAVHKIWLQSVQWCQGRSRLKLWTDDGQHTTEPAYTISSPRAKNQNFVFLPTFFHIF